MSPTTTKELVFTLLRFLLINNSFQHNLRQETKAKQAAKILASAFDGVVYSEFDIEVEEISEQ